MAVRVEIPRRNHDQDSAFGKAIGQVINGRSKSRLVTARVNFALVAKRNVDDACLGIGGEKIRDRLFQLALQQNVLIVFIVVIRHATGKQLSGWHKSSRTIGRQQVAVCGDPAHAGPMPFLGAILWAIENPPSHCVRENLRVAQRRRDKGMLAGHSAVEHHDSDQIIRGLVGDFQIANVRLKKFKVFKRWSCRTVNLLHLRHLQKLSQRRVVQPRARYAN